MIFRVVEEMYNNMVVEVMVKVVGVTCTRMEVVEVTYTHMA